MTAHFGEVGYGGETIRFEVRRLGSRRTLGIEVHPDGRVLVRAPADCPAEVIDDRVKRRARWITRQLADLERYRPRTPPRHYVSGETHLYLGRQYRLKVSPGDRRSVKLTRGHLLVSLPEPCTPARCKNVLRLWYRDRARSVFREALAASLGHFEELERPRLIIRTLQSRWGSLSPSGTMTLNVDLVRAPRACIEYVVVHELCHLKHPHHGAEFYRLLEGVMPDWQQRKEKLEIALV